MPYQINDTYIYQEEEILYVTSERGFALTCNMKFDVCLFELSGKLKIKVKYNYKIKDYLSEIYNVVSGWYFGKTAGLLGSIDNEPSNDFKTPSGQIAEVDEFAHSWSLGPCTPEESKNIAHKTPQPSNELISKCESMFLSPASHLSPCFTAVSQNKFRKISEKSMLPPSCSCSSLTVLASKLKFDIQV